MWNLFGSFTEPLKLLLWCIVLICRIHNTVSWLKNVKIDKKLHLRGLVIMATPCCRRCSAFHLWRRQESCKWCWLASVVLFTLQNEVNAIKWDPQGNLLASCSDDMTLKVLLPLSTLPVILFVVLHGAPIKILAVTTVVKSSSLFVCGTVGFWHSLKYFPCTPIACCPDFCFGCSHTVHYLFSSSD